METDDCWLGAMPAEEFLDKFLRINKNPESEPLPIVDGNPFRDITTHGPELHYDKFINVITQWIPHMIAVNAHTKEDATGHHATRKPEPDISLYDHNKDTIPLERTDFARLELLIEFKRKAAAFHDPEDTTTPVESDKPRSDYQSFTPSDPLDAQLVRDQLAHYAGLHHGLQFRHFSFSIFIEDDHARFLRWDPSGTIVTAAFDYYNRPQILAEFFWLFDHLAADQRGHDKSVRPAQLSDEVAARIREKLLIEDKTVALFEYDVPNLEQWGHAYGPQPPLQNPPLVSRRSRGLPVLWIPDPITPGWLEESVVYMKDTWRLLPASSEVVSELLPELEIYRRLHDVQTPNIPSLYAGGDVEDGRTTNQDFVVSGAQWLCTAPRSSPYQHYRMLLGPVGHALNTFKCTRTLVTGVLDAIEAHSHAFEKARILHRDPSIGNILLTDEGKGLLIDWESAECADESRSRRLHRMGTWPFMSAALLLDDRKTHTFTDDLEAFLHVLAYTTLRFLPAAPCYSPGLRALDMTQFDQHVKYQVEVDGEVTDRELGGDRKADCLGSGWYPSRSFKPLEPTPICDLLRTLSLPFKSLYCLGIQDEVDLEHLRSSSWFIATIKEALAKGNWPKDDKAVAEGLPIHEPFEIPEDGQQMVSFPEPQTIMSNFIRSMGLPVGSKRAAPSSPAPESGVKRRRCTPSA